MSFLLAKQGISLPYRRFCFGNESLLQAFFESLTSKTLEIFLPHQFDFETIKKVAERSESEDDLVLIALDPTSSFVVVMLSSFVHTLETWRPLSETLKAKQYGAFSSLVIADNIRT